MGWGEAAALSSACCWAIAVAMFRGPIADYGARVVNLAKSTVACVLLGITLLLLGQGSLLVSASPRNLMLIALSGLLGLTLGDTALFAAVDRVGPPRALLLQTTTPVWTALLDYAWRGARPSPGQMLGGGLILLGVVLVLSHRAVPASSDGRGTASSAAALGLGLALFGAFGQAGGIVLAKEAMQEIPIVSASFVRLGVAGLGLMVMLGLAGRLRASTRVMASREGLTRLVPASILGTYLAFLLMMTGVALSPAAVAAVLLATVPVWSLLIAARWERRPIHAREWIGTAVAIAGVALVAAR